MSTVFDAPILSPAMARVVRRLALDTQYVLLGFPLGLITVILCLTGFCLGVGLAPTVLGLPLLVGVLFVARGFAVVERVRVSAALDRRLPHPRYRRITGPAGFWRRIGSATGRPGWTCCTARSGFASRSRTPSGRATRPGRSAAPPSPPRPSRCAGWNATSTTGRSSG